MMLIVLFSTNDLKKKAYLLLIGCCVIILCWMPRYFTEASYFSDSMLGQSYENDPFISGVDTYQYILWNLMVSSPGYL